MKNISLLMLIGLFSISLSASAQENRSDTLYTDLDHDLIKDVITIDRQSSMIICKLSTQKFKSIRSQELELDPSSSGIRKTKSGFEYYNNWMRAGYTCQFRYNPKEKQVQLIGMSRYEFGSASNDGSGESSVNLLTHDYIGNWNYFDNNKMKLIPIPSIKKKMIFPAVYLSKYTEKTFYKYQDWCAQLFEKAKAKMLQKG